MKTRISIFLGILSLLTLFSCAKEELDYMLYTDTDKVVVSPTGGVYEVAVRSNSDWTAEVTSGDKNGWLSIEAPVTSGDEEMISIIVSENDLAEDRVATITVSAGDEAVSVAVVQKSAGSFSMDRLMANNYYGDQFSNGTGYVEIELRGGDTDYAGNPQGIAQIVKLALYTEMAADPERAQLQDGTYVLSSKAAGQSGTFFIEDDATGIWCYDEYKNISFSPLAEGSSVRVTPRAEDSYSIVGEFVTEDGNVYDWYYEGNIKLVNANHLTTDKDGYTIMRYGDGGLQVASFQGDLDGYRGDKGTVKYTFDIRTKTESTNFGFSVAFYRSTTSENSVPSYDEADITGTYGFSGETGDDYSIEAGSVMANGVAWGSYCYAVDNVKTVTHMVTGGTMTIARYDEDEYDVKFDLKGQNAPGAADEYLGKYRYIGPLPFSNDNPVTYSVNTPRGIEASYVVVNTAEGIARYDIILTKNADDHYQANAEYFQLSLYSESPRDEQGNVIDESEAETKGAVSNIQSGTYTMAYNTDWNTDPSGAQEFTWEMIHYEGFYFKGTGYQVYINEEKTALVPYDGEVNIERNEDGSYNITVENMPMYDYYTNVPIGVLKMSSMNLVLD